MGVAVDCLRCRTENDDTNLRCSSCGDLLPRPGAPVTAPPVSRVCPDEQRDAEPLNNLTEEECLPLPPGMRSPAERLTYQDIKRDRLKLRVGSVHFDRKALGSIALIDLIGALFIVFTFLPWNRLGNGLAVTGWDFFHLGRAGLNGGNAFYIPDILVINKISYQIKTGMILTGLCTLTGGILLVATSPALLLTRWPRFLHVGFLVSFALLVVSVVNFIAIYNLSQSNPQWPIYAMPVAAVFGMITAVDAHRVI